MSQSSKKQNILFMLLGVAAFASGIFQIVQKLYLMGICAVIIGTWHAWKNYSEYKIK